MKVYYPQGWTLVIDGYPGSWAQPLGTAQAQEKRIVAVSNSRPQRMDGRGGVARPMRNRLRKRSRPRFRM